MKYVYPSIFTEEAEGGFSVRFPDLPGALTCGDDINEAMEMAEDCLALMLYDYEVDEKKIPEPSDINSIKCSKGEFASMIQCDTLVYRQLNNNRSVNKTLTIPEWLNVEAQRKGINFSQVLQEALKDKLHIG